MLIAGKHMKYFFNLNDDNWVMDIKVSEETVPGWTQVSEFNYYVVLNMLNNPNSIVNTSNGRPEYIDGRVGVVIPHPKGALPTLKVSNGEIINTIVGIDGKPIREEIIRPGSDAPPEIIKVY